MPRTKTHVLETNSKDYIRSKINSYYPNGDALAREWNEKDYGIDLFVEFFKNGIPTGNIAYIQLKATENQIKKNSKTEDISCPNVSACSLEYAKQRKIPFILIYISMIEPITFYYVDIQSLNVNELLHKSNKNSSRKTTVRIPIKNVSNGNLDGLFNLIYKYF